jgi:hypothetical protein
MRKISPVPKPILCRKRKHIVSSCAAILVLRHCGAGIEAGKAAELGFSQLPPFPDDDASTVAAVPVRLMKRNLLFAKQRLTAILDERRTAAGIYSLVPWALLVQRLFFIIDTIKPGRPGRRPSITLPIEWLWDSTCINWVENPCAVITKCSGPEFFQDLSNGLLWCHFVPKIHAAQCDLLHCEHHL